MAEIKANFGSLSGDAGGIQANYRALVSTLEGMEQQLAPMVSTWTGDAQTAYFQQRQKWDQAAPCLEVRGRDGRATPGAATADGRCVA